MQIPKHDLFSFSHLMGKILVSAVCTAGCQQRAQFLGTASIIFIPKMYVVKRWEEKRKEGNGDDSLHLPLASPNYMPS